MTSIVVGCVLRKEDKFLLVQEAKSSCYGKWNIPAGRLQSNESIYEGAIREMYEETGCKVEITGLIQIANRKEINNFLAIIFEAKIKEYKIDYNHEEILDVQWFSYDEIIKMKTENKLRNPKLIIEAIKRALDNNAVSLDIVDVI